jgi:hypothetical protein
METGLLEPKVKRKKTGQMLLNSIFSSVDDIPDSEFNDIDEFDPNPSFELLTDDNGLGLTDLNYSDDDEFDQEVPISDLTADDPVIKIYSDAVIFEPLPSLEEDIVIASKQDRIVVKASRHLYWVYRAVDHSLVSLQPESTFNDKQAINQLMARGLIDGYLTDYYTQEFFLCPICSTKHTKQLDRCSNQSCKKKY